jgi:hypothetical protein
VYQFQASKAVDLVRPRKLSGVLSEALFHLEAKMAVEYHGDATNEDLLHLFDKMLEVLVRE